MGILFPPFRAGSLRHGTSAARRAWILALAIALAFSTSLRAENDRKVLEKEKPVYPELAKRLKVSGTVLLNVRVDASGKVREANVVMGEKLLTDAAKTAVLKWRYEPAKYETVEDVEVDFH
jgi:TonB family protein